MSGNLISFLVTNSPESPSNGLSGGKNENITSPRIRAFVLANADATDLFTVLWDAANVTNSQIQLYDSAGATAAKGDSAATDFAAHKRLKLPDLRGRTLIGLDNMGGTPANIVTNSSADVLGGTGGAEAHTLTASQIPAHKIYLGQMVTLLMAAKKAREAK